jgi:hypothetical protein
MVDDPQLANSWVLMIQEGKESRLKIKKREKTKS